MTGVDAFARSFDARLAVLPGAQRGAVQQARRRAFERFARLGLPTNKLEEWRDTSVAQLARAPFESASALSPPIARASLAALVPFAFDQPRHRLVFVDGRFEPGLSALVAEVPM